MTDEQLMSGRAIYDEFFERGEVRASFRKEYISLWTGWLGKDRLHLLAEHVTPELRAKATQAVDACPRQALSLSED